MMPDLTLYHMPGSCSQVVLSALEETGCNYLERTVNLMAGVQYGPDFRALSFKSKVPVLLEGTTVITELPAILFRLAVLFPAARLLPLDVDGAPSISGLSDLIWGAGTVQPLVSRLFRPESVAPGCADEVSQIALGILSDQARVISDRVASGWWYGETWSIVDSFLVWIYRTATKLGFAIGDFPELQAHTARVEQREPHRRTIEVERLAMARDGLAMPAGL